MMQTHALKEYEGHGVFLGVVVFLAIYLLLTFFNPEFVQRDCGKHHGDEENDPAKSMLWSLGILALIVVGLWLLWWLFSACF